MLTMLALTPKASIHIAKDNKNKQEKNSNSKLEEVQFQGRRNIASNIIEECHLAGRVCHQLKESALLLEILIELLFTQSNLYLQQNGRHFIANLRR